MGECLSQNIHIKDEKLDVIIFSDEPYRSKALIFQGNLIFTPYNGCSDVGAFAVPPFSKSADVQKFRRIAGCGTSSPIAGDEDSMSDLFATNEEATLDQFDFEVLNAPVSDTPGATPLLRDWNRQSRIASMRHRAGLFAASGAYRPRAGAGYPDFH